MKILKRATEKYKTEVQVINHIHFGSSTDSYMEKIIFFNECMIVSDVIWTVT